jgi:hypothetical protein
MTFVRQKIEVRSSSKRVAAGKGAKRSAVTAKAPRGGGRAAKAGPRKSQARTSAGVASQVAQVRLQADEMAALRGVMRQLDLPSTSEALREGIRLLIREAAEVAAAEEIRRFYGDQPVPLPDGVVPATQEELDAADAEQW